VNAGVLPVLEAFFKKRKFRGKRLAIDRVKSVYRFE